MAAYDTWVVILTREVHSLYHGITRFKKLPVAAVRSGPFDSNWFPDILVNVVPTNAANSFILHAYGTPFVTKLFYVHDVTFQVNVTSPFVTKLRP